ncbi:hypothetical protein B0T25DRAFT_608574, partial [Lasiosphaeria hispida]
FSLRGSRASYERTATALCFQESATCLSVDIPKEPAFPKYSSTASEVPRGCRILRQDPGKRRKMTGGYEEVQVVEPLKDEPGYIYMYPLSLDNSDSVIITPAELGFTLINKSAESRYTTLVMTPSGKKQFPNAFGGILRIDSVRRRWCRPETTQALTSLAYQFVDDNWCMGVKQAVQAALSICDPRLPMREQNLYWQQVHAPMERGHSPNWIALMALYCLYFARIPEEVHANLVKNGYAWMWSTKVEFDASLTAVRDPSRPSSDWVPCLLTFELDQGLEGLEKRHNEQAQAGDAASGFVACVLLLLIIYVISKVLSALISLLW